MGNIKGSIKVSTAFWYAEESYRDYNFKIGETEALLSTHYNDQGAVQVVGIRGTETNNLLTSWNSLDIVKDLRIMPWYDKRVGWSHKGMLRGAQDIVDKGLKGGLRRELPIAIVGHSLGAGIGLNVALMLLYDGFNVTDLIGFGSPRVLFKGSAKEADDTFLFHGTRVMQISNPHDPVTKVPPEWMRYSHVRYVSTGRKCKDNSILDVDEHILDNYKTFAKSCKF